MKYTLVFFFFLIIGGSHIIAQTDGKFDGSEKKSSKKNNSEKAMRDVQIDGELRKQPEYREQLVEGGNKKYEKKFRKRKVPKGTIMGDCPGDPKSKFNKRNPHKHHGRV